MNPLIRAIPPFWVRTFARPYVAGDSLARALDVATALQREGLTTTLDLLAEDIESEADAERNCTTYLEMADAVASDARFADALRPTLSLKPSSYTAHPLHRGGDARGSRAAIERIVARATLRGVQVTIDMESRNWTDFTLDTFSSLYRAGHRQVGIVLQTRLHRTESDIDRLPEGCRVRLVIGIYNEPSDVALYDKQAMKERMLTFGDRLLRAGHPVEFATHDDTFVRRFLDEVVPATGAKSAQYEIQMLYGVPRARLQRELVASGVRTRLYLPFALGWPMAIAYLRRRLDEYPQMMWLVAKNLFTGR